MSISLGVLELAACAQVAILLLSGSVARLADLIHNVGDAPTRSTSHICGSLPPPA